LSPLDIPLSPFEDGEARERNLSEASSLQDFDGDAGESSPAPKDFKVLKVTDMFIQNLKVKYTVGSTPKPFLHLTLGTTEQKTCKMSGADAKFKEKFNFVIKNPNADALVVRVLDHYSLLGDDLLGSMTLPISDIVANVDIDGVYQHIAPVKMSNGKDFTAGMKLTLMN